MKQGAGEPLEMRRLCSNNAMKELGLEYRKYFAVPGPAFNQPRSQPRAGGGQCAHWPPPARGWDRGWLKAGPGTAKYLRYSRPSSFMALLEHNRRISSGSPAPCFTRTWLGVG